MTTKDRRALAAAWKRDGRISVLDFCEQQINKAVRRARREARSEATTCVDCRVVLLAEVPLCHSCTEIRDVYGIDRDSRKRFYADAAKRQEDRECEEAADMADVRGARR